MRHRLTDLIRNYPEVQGNLRGKGFVWGIESNVNNFSVKVARKAFQSGLLIETAGPGNKVLKWMPPLIIDENGLNSGLDIIEQTFKILTNN